MYLKSCTEFATFYTEMWCLRTLVWRPCVILVACNLMFATGFILLVTIFESYSCTCVICCFVYYHLWLQQNGLDHLCSVSLSGMDKALFGC
jgi:hypothetical protein